MIVFYLEDYLLIRIVYNYKLYNMIISVVKYLIYYKICNILNINISIKLIIWI